MVIRDSSGKVLCQLSGPIHCLDSNAVEVYAMLMGCWELPKLASVKAILEGDFFLQFSGGQVSDMSLAVGGLG